jgi:electron transport complex protein RnfG
MREMIQMVIVLTVLSCVSGGMLAFIKDGTAAQIEYQQLKFVKGPAILEILTGSSNDPITDRFKLQDGDIERSFYVGVFDGKAETVAFECTGKGYGGDIGVMVGVNLAQGQLIGAGVTTHQETPGVGARAKTDPAFPAQFKGMDIGQDFQVKTDGGEVDALSGATITSRGVCMALNEAKAVYERLKPQLADQLKQFE